MSIASEITRLQGVKSDILTAIGNKGVTVPAGSALDDCPGLIASITGGGYTPIQGTTELFGKTYNTIKINGLEWICENLDYIWQGLAIGHDTTSQQACYVNDDETTWGWNGRKCGLLYNNSAMKYLQENILNNNDWRVCTIDDLDKLAKSTNSYFDAGYHLSVTESWGSISGDNSIFFNEKPCGGWESMFYETGVSFYINLYTSQNKYMAFRRSSEGNLLSYGIYTGNWYTPIRLCKTLSTTSP